MKQKQNTLYVYLLFIKTFQISKGKSRFNDNPFIVANLFIHGWCSFIRCHLSSVHLKCSLCAENSELINKRFFFGHFRGHHFIQKVVSRIFEYLLLNDEESLFIYFIYFNK